MLKKYDQALMPMFQNFQASNGLVRFDSAASHQHPITYSASELSLHLLSARCPLPPLITHDMTSVINATPHPFSSFPITCCPPSRRLSEKTTGRLLLPLCSVSFAVTRSSLLSSTHPCYSISSPSSMSPPPTPVHSSFPQRF